MKKTNKRLTQCGLPALAEKVSPVTTGYESSVIRSLGFMSMEPPSLPSYIRNSFMKPLLTSSHVAEKGESSYQHVDSVESWRVTDVTLPPLPDFHPLETTAVFAPHTSACTVASRVISVLRERSISSTFNTPKAKAKCITSYNVEFRVRLYRGKGEFSHGVIVEVQRRYGFSPHFQADIQAILDAAEGKRELVTSLHHPSVTDNDTVDSSYCGSLNLLSELIDSEKYDSQLLALSGLNTLTDAREVGTDVSEKTIQLLHQDEHEYVRSRLLDLAISCHLRCNKSDELNDQAIILSKVLAVSSWICRSVCSGTCDSFESLSPILLSSLENAHVNTCLASQSALVVFELLKNSRHNNHFLKSDKFMNAMYTAQSAGNIRDVNLFQISSRCIELMV